MAEPTLDAVALHVLQLEPEDHARLGLACERLARLARADRTGPVVRPYVLRAVRVLESLAHGTAADPAAAMREVGCLLQRATDVGDAVPRADGSDCPGGSAAVVEECAAAQAALAGDPGFIDLARRNGEFADKAARVARAVGGLQRLAGPR